MEMTENNGSFPVNSREGEEYGEKEEREVTSPNGLGLYHSPPDGSHMYLTPEEQAAGVHLKRRRRCGQCGPCQVKENCNKCHYCVRKDVLKQTCVYRKCIYLRSKPKPYMRNPSKVVPFNARSMISSPHQSIPPPGAQNFISAETSVEMEAPNSTEVGSLVKPPSVTSTDTTSQNIFSDRVVSKESSDNDGAIVSQTTSLNLPPQPFPFSIPQPQRPFQMDSVLGQNAHFPGSASVLGGGTIPSVPIPHRIDHTAGPFTSSHSLVPGLTSPMEKSISDFSNQRYPHLHMPFPHSLRDSQSMINMHYPTYSKSLTESRPNARSPCMYGPSLSSYPSAMSAMSSGPFDRGPIPPNPLDTLDRHSNGTTYLPNNSDLFRQYSALPSATPGYPYSTPHSRFPSPHSYPHSGYPPSSTYSGYSGFGMPHPPNIPIPSAIPGSTPPFGTYSASSALSSINQTHGCPKNGQHPPASQTLVIALMQEMYGCIRNSRDSVPSSDISSDEKNSLETYRIRPEIQEQEGDSSIDAYCASEVDIDIFKTITESPELIKEQMIQNAEETFNSNMLKGTVREHSSVINYKVGSHFEKLNRFKLGVDSKLLQTRNIYGNREICQGFGMFLFPGNASDIWIESHVCEISCASVSHNYNEKQCKNTSAFSDEDLPCNKGHTAELFSQNTLPSLHAKLPPLPSILSSSMCNIFCIHSSRTAHSSSEQVIIWSSTQSFLEYDGNKIDQTYVRGHIMSIGCARIQMEVPAESLMNETFNEKIILSSKRSKIQEKGRDCSDSIRNKPIESRPVKKDILTITKGVDEEGFLLLKNRGLKIGDSDMEERLFALSANEE